MTQIHKLAPPFMSASRVQLRRGVVRRELLLEIGVPSREPPPACLWQYKLSPMTVLRHNCPFLQSEVQSFRGVRLLEDKLLKGQQTFTLTTVAQRLREYLPIFTHYSKECSEQQKYIVKVQVLKLEHFLPFQCINNM